MRLRFVFVCWLAGGLGFSLAVRAVTRPAPGQSNSRPQRLHFERDIKPLLARYCYDCHGEKKKGDLDLRVYTDEKSAAGARQIFEKVLKNLQAHEMPPEKKPQPTSAERDLVTSWVSSFFFPCDCDHPDPGRVTLHRLNRSEYNNTIRDLVGVKFRPADDFPADDSGYGFDNIGDVLSLSPALLEKYLAAAEKILDSSLSPSEGERAGVKGPFPPRGATNQEAQKLQGGFSLALACNAADGADPQTRLERARQIIADFARRAFRRPVSPEEVNRLMELFKPAEAEGQSFRGALKQPLEAVLVSPRFLFRGELPPAGRDGKPSQSCPVDDYALASRLSYFLWSSMPDEELFRQAQRRTLRRNLDGQVKRMLKDPKASALAENFAGQWLQLRNLKLAAPDAKLFPKFNEALRAAMQKETDLFFESILREDRSVLDFIGADYTFLNERLARFYGLGGVTGDAFQRVSLKDQPRGGLLTQASILTLTSNPTRTSPVKRGKWVLENLLGAPPPPPPPNVPKLEEVQSSATNGTLRQRMEQHRANTYCASCHSRMDPIGFGFENFDGIGAWRERDAELPIDPSGQLAGGESFSGPAELKAILLNQKRDEFVRCLTEKLLTFALGRGLEYYDKCAVDKISKNLARQRYKFSTLVLEIVKSVPFQMQRAEDRATSLAFNQKASP